MLYMKKENKKIGHAIKMFRKLKGLSQMSLAERIGVSYQQIQKYEKGASALSITRLTQLANALEVPLASFFPGEQETVLEQAACYGRLDDDEQQLLHLFRAIKDRKGKRAVLAFLKALAE